MEILTINNEEFIQGFTQDGEIIPIDKLIKKFKEQFKKKENGGTKCE